MKSLIIVAVLFAVSATFANATACHDPLSHESYKQGASWSAGDKCARYTCVEGSQNLKEQGCPMYKIRAECHLTAEDRSKPYPDCCPQPACPERD